MARNPSSSPSPPGLTLAGTRVAFAYWSSTGSGHGTAQTGVTAAFTITADPAEGEPLTPGGPSQTVPFTVTHPVTGTLYLETVMVRVANDDGSTWTAVPGCTAADYAASVITSPPAPALVASGQSVSGTATITMVNRSTNQDACQGASVPLYFAAITGTP